jgi:hypothetical protein
MSLCGFAQKNHLSTRINVELFNQPLGFALEEISKQGGFKFSYNTQIIEEDSIISLSAENTKVKSILKTLFPNSAYQYKSIGQHLIIYKVEASNTTPKRVIVSGYVRDGRTGGVLTKATIYNVNRDVVATSDSKGYYEIDLSENQNLLSLNFCKSGYRDSIIHIRPLSQTTNIQLIPKYKKINALSSKNLSTQTSALHQRSLVKLIVSDRQIENSNNLKLYRNSPLQVSFLPMLGSNGLLSGTVENRFSINIISGYSRSVNGLELGGFLNIIREDLRGTQLSGFGNVVGKSSKGLQASGFFNYNIGAFTGAQLTGFSNVVTGDIEGIQVAGFLNTLRGKMDGAQLAGFTNLTTENTDGFQIAGFSNVTFKDVKLAQIAGFGNYGGNIDGLQIAGFGNLAKGDVNALQAAGFMNAAYNVKHLQIAGFMNVVAYTNSGFQIAGFMNMATQIEKMQVAGFMNIALHENNGGQIAGFLNVAKKIRGIQIGVLNISDTIYNGIPLGIMSVVAKGTHVLEISSDELFPVNFAFKTGVPHFYNIFKIGFAQNEIYPAYGVGTSIALNTSLGLTFDVIGGILLSTSSLSSLSKTRWSINPSLTYKISKNFSIAAGPTLNLGVSARSLNEPLSGVSSYSFIDGTSQNYYTQAWLGAHIAVKLF